MSPEERFKEWLAKRLPPPPQASKWSDSDMDAAWTKGWLAAVEWLVANRAIIKWSDSEF